MNDSFQEDLSICNLGLSAQHKEYTACNIRINSAHNLAFIQRLNLQVIIKYCGRPFCNMKTNNMQFLFVKMMDCMATHHRGVYRMNPGPLCDTDIRTLKKLPLLISDSLYLCFLFPFYFQFVISE